MAEIGYKTESTAIAYANVVLEIWFVAKEVDEKLCTASKLRPLSVFIERRQWLCRNRLHR